MPAPVTVDELLDLVQKSGVVDETRLKPYMAKLSQQGAVPKEPAKFAGVLVRDGMLTYFQAEQLLQGKYKRFSLGKYKVLEKLGSGGMGTVFLCEHKLMRRRVAVKVLPSAKAADDASLQRFYREARAVAAVDHPNIVRAYDIDQDDNLHFLVMEYVDGTNLQDLVKKFGPVDVLRSCHYIYGAAVGLQHAHEIGLVHRDIKPGNILLDRSGVVKILDLGLARFFNDSDDNLTKQYDENILGTADYLSPEQAEDSHTVDIRTDLYSLGATFYFLLTGHQPFPEGTIPQKLIWHRSREPKSIREIRPEVPEEIAAVVVKMMAKKSANRYQTPSEVMAALSAWASTPIPPPPEREMPQLSPAVSGGIVGGSRPIGGPSPRSMVASAPLMAGQLGQSGAPTLSGGNTPGPGRGSGNRSTIGGNESNEAVWESLADVPTDTPIDAPPTLRSPIPAPQSDRYRPQASAKKNRLLPLIVSGVAVLLIAGAVGAYFIFADRKPGGNAPVPPGPKRLIVSKAQHAAGTENAFPSLAAALRAATAGDTIAIAESPLAESFIRFPPRSKDITIESGLSGKLATIVFSSTSGAAGAMIDLSSTENARLKDLDLDGQGVADYGVVVSGSAPGATIENVSVRNVKTAAFRLHNVAGVAGRPVTLDRVRVLLAQANEAAVVVSVPANVTLESRHVAIRNSRFEGPGKVGIKFDGSVLEADVAGNRFHKLDAAIFFTRVAENRPFKARVAQNTINEAKIGVQFGGPGAGKMDVDFTRNYFAATAEIVNGGAVPGVASTENGQRGSKPGNGSVAALPIDAPVLPPPNPDDDATFLRFPAGAGPMLGAVRVGAN